MKEFDYYIFIDYSEDYLGYLIVSKEKIKEALLKTTKFKHYKEVRCKSAYIKSVKKSIQLNELYLLFDKIKIKKKCDTLEIYFEILNFLKNNFDKKIFICVDDKQYFSFQKMTNIFNSKEVFIIKESKLNKYSSEYKLNLILDTILNLTRLNNTG